MHFALICIDKPDHGQVRADNREAHVAYLKAQGDKLTTAGPFLSDDGSAMTGSLIVLDVADKAEAEAFVAGDPYGKAGLFQFVEIRPWKKVI